jgi:hypothetical protein
MAVERTCEMGAILLSLNVLKFCRRKEICRCFKREWFQENGQQQHDDRSEHFVIKITEESCVLLEMPVPAHYTHNWKAWEAVGFLSLFTDDGILLGRICWMANKMVWRILIPECEEKLRLGVFESLTTYTCRSLLKSEMQQDKTVTFLDNDRL